MWVLKEHFQDSGLSLHHRGPIFQSKYQKMSLQFSQTDYSGEARLFDNSTAVVYILQDFNARMSNQKRFNFKLQLFVYTSIKITPTYGLTKSYCFVLFFISWTKAKRKPKARQSGRKACVAPGCKPHKAPQMLHHPPVRALLTAAQLGGTSRAGWLQVPMQLCTCSQLIQSCLRVFSHTLLEK